MRCKVCGGNMKIEDEYCPFCGMKNPDAGKHREDMKKYEKRFSRTEKEVITTAENYSRKSVKVVVLLVLVILVLVLVVLNVFHYDIAHAIDENRIRKNENVHREQLDYYEETEQYLAMAKYYGANSLWRVDEFDEYGAVINVANYYGYTMEKMLDLLGRDIKIYSDTESALQGLCEYVQWMYDECEKDEYAAPEQWTELHTKSIENMKEEMNLLIQTYCGFSDEEMDRFESVNEARKQIMVEEAMGLYDTDTES